MNDRAAALSKKIDDLTESIQSPKMLGFDFRRFGQPLVKYGEDFNALDRIDAEIGIQAHCGTKHFGRVTGFVGDNLQQDPLNMLLAPGCRWRRRLKHGSRRDRPVGGSR